MTRSIFKHFEKEEMYVGQKVRVIPDWTNKMKPCPESHEMYVKELGENLAGLSHTMENSTVYGVLYQVIYPVSPIGEYFKDKSEEQLKTLLFSAYLTGKNGQDRTFESWYADNVKPLLNYFFQKNEK